MQQSGRDKVRVGLFAGVVVVGAIVAAYFAGQVQQELTSAVEQLGATAPLAFMAAYAFLTLLLVPGSVLTVAAGFLFGPLWGTVVAVVGGAIGSTAAFLIGRRLGRQQVERIAGERTTRIDERVRLHGVQALIVMRVLPGVPYSVLNYAAGVSAISVRDYVLGTALGLVPGGFAYATLGAGLGDLTSPEFIGGLALIGLMLTVSTIIDRRRHVKAKRAS